MLAGAFDTLSDILISAFLLVSISWSRKPADEFHMFGHGRIQNVASLITATIFIFFISLETFRAAVLKIFQTEVGEFQNINLALIVTIIAIVVYAIPLVDILRTEGKGSAVKAQLYALIEMEVAFIVSFFSIILVARGYKLVDPIASLFIGMIIAFTGIKLLKDNAQYLIGKAPTKEFLDKIAVITKSVKGVLSIYDLKAEYVGPDIVHVGMQVKINKGKTVEESNQIIKEIRDKVHKDIKYGYCFIEIVS